MVVDCDRTLQTAQGRAFAEARGLCGLGHAKPGSVSTDASDTKYGDCGTSYLSITDYAVPGEAWIFVSLDSSLGPMSAVDWNVQWTNWTTGGGQSTGGTDFPNNTHWSRSMYPNTGAGYVTATLGGTVSLTAGGYCQILSPSAGETIT